MGVEWLNCANCDNVFCDNQDDVVYCDCGTGCWCCAECASEGGYRCDEDESSCVYCRNEDMTDGVLLDKLLQASGMSRGEAVAKFLNTT